MEKPILFNTEMVQAILEGRKASTRRIIKHDFKTVYITACANGKWCETYGENLPNNLIEWYVKEKAKPPYQVGDILYVRETWLSADDGLHYKASTSHEGDIIRKEYGYKWRPSIHMPKVAARIFLKVTDIKVQRLQDITEEDAKNEGIQGITKDGEVFKYFTNYDAWAELHKKIKKNYKGTAWQDMPKTAKEAFKYLWDSCGYKWPECWSYNPWVWVIEFERS